MLLGSAFSEHACSGIARIQKESARDAWSAVMIMSYRWPITMVSIVLE